MPTFSYMTTLPGLRLNLARLRQAGAGAFFSPRHIEALGISARRLRELVTAGDVEHVARGLYRLAAAEPTQHYTLAAVCARVPRGIVCLLSALQYHHIGTQLPRQVWVAIPHKAKPPRLGDFPVRLVRFSGSALHYGILDITLEGVPTRITSPARTVVDCFRMQRLVGRDVALEALRESVRARKATVDEIWRAAEVLRAKRLIGPALEIMST